MTVSATARVTPEQVRAAIDTVPDPEMPQVSIGDLGMVHAVHVHPAASPAGARVEIELLPTFTGCPATRMIGDDVARAVEALGGVADVEVRFSFAETWTPARITPRGHERLREAAIAPPADGPGAPPCPICGAGDTVADSPFGPTPCRSTHYCKACRNPFEAIKP